jgi:hypothetical protein
MPPSGNCSDVMYFCRTPERLRTRSHAFIYRTYKSMQDDSFLHRISSRNIFINVNPYFFERNHARVIVRVPKEHISFFGTSPVCDMRLSIFYVL